MKIAIIGAGAMGCLFGGKLSARDNEVWLMDIDEEQIKAINTHGLKIEEKDTDTGLGKDVLYKNLKATSNPSDVGVVDLAIIFVKSINTGKAILSNKEMFNSSTYILTLQNGLGNVDAILNSGSGSQVIAGTTSHGATLLEKGHIRHAGNGKTVIGELDGNISKGLERVVKAFKEADIDTDISENIEGVIWDKLLVNIGINAITAICNVKNGEISGNIKLKEIMEMAVLEAYEIAKIKGLKLNFKDPVAHTLEVSIATSENRSSMLQDVQNSRKTEIEMINGAIASEGIKYSINTPVNKMLTNLIQFKESMYGKL
jgi:2-dehydropantoate 2-reductase